MNHNGIVNESFAERVARYGRQAIPTDQRRAILGRTEALHDRLLEFGELEGAANARARWMDEAISFGTAPAGDREQAIAKVDLLRRWTSSRLIVAAIEDQPADAMAGMIAVITGAALAEAERWHLPKPGFDLVGTGAFDNETKLARLRPAIDTRRHQRCEDGPLAFGWAARRVSVVERDILALRRTGRHEAAEGARCELRLAIFRMVATQVRKVRDPRSQAC